MFHPNLDATILCTVRIERLTILLLSLEFVSCVTEPDALVVKGRHQPEQHRLVFDHELHRHR